MTINLHLSTSEAEQLADLLAWASDHLSDDYTTDPDLKALAPIAERALELIEAETVEGMIERGEIEQGALAAYPVVLAGTAEDSKGDDACERWVSDVICGEDANTWRALHHTLGDLGKASVTLPNGQPTKVHVELGPHVEFVHMRARGPWWLYATPDFDERGTIAFCLEHEETTDIPVAFDVKVTWTGDLETDLETYSEETTKALAKALESID